MQYDVEELDLANGVGWGCTSVDSNLRSPKYSVPDCEDGNEVWLELLPCFLLCAVKV